MSEKTSSQEPPHYETYLTGVVDRLRQIDGQPLCLAQWLLDHPNVNILFVCGKPGIGKTTVINQLTEDLKKNDVEEVALVNQDYFYQKKSRDYGTESEPKRPFEWTESECKGFSDEVRNTVKRVQKDFDEKAKKEKELGMDAKRRIVVIDINGLASMRNLGYTAIEDMIREHPEQVAVMAQTADNRVQTISLGMRGLISNIIKNANEERENIEKIISRDPFRIHVVWKGRLNDLTAEEKEAILLDRVSKTANPEVILRIDKEVQNLMEKIPGFNDLVSYWEELLSAEGVLKGFQAVTMIEKYSGEITTIAEETVYYLEQLKKLVKLGLPVSHALIALNFYSQQPVYWIIEEQNQ